MRNRFAIRYWDLWELCFVEQIMKKVKKFNFAGTIRNHMSCDCFIEGLLHGISKHVL